MTPFQKKARQFLLILSAIGAMFSALIFSVSFASEAQLRQSAKSFVKYQVTKEAKEKYSAAENTQFGDALEIIRNTVEGRSDEISDYMENRLEEDISNYVDIFCQCEKAALEAGDKIREQWKHENETTRIASEQLKILVKGRYTEITEALRRDLRIFSGTNLLLFLIAILALILKSRATVHLILPVTLLIIATLVAASAYIFGQDWFYTIIYSNYWGYGYTVLAGVIFLFLMDVVFNQGRITAEIVNLFFQAIGKAITVVPC